jgi:hypothetical protein
MLLGWRAKGFYQRRLHLLTLILLLDTGCGISEAPRGSTCKTLT